MASRLTLSAFCLALFACGVSTPPPRPPMPGDRVPLSVWTFTFTGDCDSELLAPALLCTNTDSYAPTKGRCSWRCPKGPVQ